MKRPTNRTYRATILLLASLFLVLLSEEGVASSDLAFGELRAPSGNIPVNVPVTIDFDVKNIGEDPSVKGEAFVSIYFVPSSGEPQQVYFEILKLSVDPGGTITPVLPDWTPDREGTYEFDANLFAVNDPNGANNGILQEFTVGTTVEPTCEEREPTRTTRRVARAIPNLAEIGIEASETLSLTYSAGKDCCWDLSAVVVKVQGEGTMIFDGEPTQRTEEGSPASFTFRLQSSTPITDLAVFNAEISWVRCDSPQVNGKETILILFMPEEPGLASEGQKTTAANPAAGKSGDPVNTATGELFIPWSTDLSIGVNPPLSFRRYYASNLNGFFAPTASIGTNWSHNYAWRLEQIDSLAIVVMPSGRRVLFEETQEGWRPRSRHETDWQLVASGNVWRFGDPRRSVIREFNADGELTAIVGRDGAERRMVWSEGRLAAVESDGGRRLDIEYSGEKITSVSDGTRTVRYGYESDLLSSVTDSRGNRSRMTYDNGGLLTGMERPEGNTPFTQTWDGEQRVVTQTDGAGGLWRFAYGDGATTITGPDGTTEEHHHSRARELEKRVDQEENPFTVEYDEKGRPIVVVDRLGDTTRTTYDDASGLPTSITGADGQTTSYEWQATTVEGITFQDLVRVVYPDGTTNEITTNEAGYPTRTVDRNGNATTFAYDGEGRMISTTLPNGATTRRTYGPTGLLDSVIGPDGRTTVITYDPLDRPVTIERPDGTATEIGYDENNNRTMLVDGAGDTLRFEYDRNNNLTALVDREGGRTELEYDQLDRQVVTIDPEGRRSTQVYDNRGHLAAMVNGAGDTLRVEYDPAGRVVAMVDGLGNRLGREVDAEGVVTATVSQEGKRTSIESDLLGRVTGRTDPLGRRTTWVYDELGRVTAVTDPTGKSEDLGYDDGGRLTRWTSPGGISASFSYSTIGYLTSITDPLGSRWSFTQNGSGDLVSERDPLENETGYGYDALGRMTEVELPGELGKISYTLDARGNTTAIAYPDGSNESYSYDRNDRLVAGNDVTVSYDRSGGIDTVNGIAVDRDAAGRISQFTYAPGKEIAYRYDARGLLVEIVDWVGGSTSLAWDVAGRLSSLERPNGRTTTWKYDDAGRVIEVVEEGVARIGLELDELGRTVRAERSGYLVPTIENDTTARAYDAASQRADASYDQLGRLLNDNGRTYQWSPASRLAEMTEEGTVSTWEYDGVGNVVARSVDGSALSSVRNYALANQNVAVDRAEDGSDERYYVHAPSGYLLYSINASDNERRFYHYDELGSTLLLSDESGAVTDRYAYTPYGAPAGEEGETENRYRFVGAWGVELESGSGLYRMGARLYDALSARFISRDPARLIHPKQLNPYRYALGNPLSYVDVDGREESERDIQLGKIRNSMAGDQFSFLAKLLYGTSVPPPSERRIPLLDPPSTGNDFEEEDPIELGDGEVIFNGPNEVGSNYHPGESSRRSASPRGVDPGPPIVLETPQPFFLPKLDPRTRAYLPAEVDFLFDLLALLERSGGQGFYGTNPLAGPDEGLTLPPLDDRQTIGSGEENQIMVGGSATERETPGKVVIYIEGIRIVLPKGTVLGFPDILITPPDEEDPWELGDGEEIL